jgi:hypothetical protein
MSNLVKKEYGFLNDNEIIYLQQIKDNFVYSYTGEYDIMKTDYTKLENYRNNLKKYVKNNHKDEFTSFVTELNRVRDIDDMDSYHFDENNLTFVTYFDLNFEGGEFEYIVDSNENTIEIKPEINLTLIMDNYIPHRVKKVTKGTRYALVTFCFIKGKKTKTLL